MYILTSAISGVFGLIFMILWIVLTVFTLISVLRNHEHLLSVGNKILWIAIIIVVPIIGSLVYLFWKSAKRPEA